MKSVKTSVGTTYLYLRQLYCYSSVISALREKVSLPGFIEKCERWRNRVVHSDVYEDVYDGRMWTQFLNPDGIPFLSLPYNFALCLNVDWFQPFKHSMYACGAAYISILNLPRSERYSSDNVILLGVIPGPKEPELTINSFLEPLVDELLQLWNGVVMKAHNSSVLVRSALICVACDIPAARKVCGFVSHNSLLACSRCLKVFPTKCFGDKADYSGFDRDIWPPRSLAMHRMYALEHRDAVNKGQRKAIERDHGCRYCVLLKLPYFNPITMCIVDPMHNLLLGSAKHMLNVWKEMKLLTDDHFEAIQTKVDSFFTPEDVGRIPTKISSGCSGFKAEQWRNWTLLFSLYSLKDILPYSHYNCWQLFVKACHLLCRRTITSKEISDADMLLNEYCLTFENLYGKEHCNINLHLHGHLHECLKDYGPVYAFWLFAFERLNGILGSFHTNCHDLSLQIMRRFFRTKEFQLQTFSNEYKNDFSPLIEKCVYNKGSLKHTCLKDAIRDNTCVHPLPPVRESALTPEQRRSISNVICCVYPNIGESVEVLTLFQKCSALRVGEFLLGATSGRHKSAAIVFVKSADRPKLVHIHYFLKCSYVHMVDGRNTTSTLWLANISHLLEHPCKVWYGYPTEVWSKFEASESLFIPSLNIHSRVAYVSTR